MPYAIQTQDKLDHGHLRAELRDAHLAYLDANLHKLLAAGALIHDHGTGGHGGLLTAAPHARPQPHASVAAAPLPTAAPAANPRQPRSRS